MKTRRYALYVLLAAMILLLSNGPAAAQTERAHSGDYVVQKGDWLAAIAAREYGDAALYPAIVVATNTMAVSDGTYSFVADPFLIEPGWKLYLPTSSEAQAGLTVTKLENGSYTSQWTHSGVADLVDGRFSEAAAPGSATKTVILLSDRMAFGRSASGEQLAAVVQVTDPGGSGTFYDLSLVVEREGKPVHVATANFGDRVRIASLGIEDGEIVINLLRQGPDDPMCCPTEQAVIHYAFQDDSLVRTYDSAAPKFALSNWGWAQSIGGDTDDLSVSDPAQYTLQLNLDGTFGFRADCNVGRGEYTYNGTALTLQPTISTRAQCPDDSLDDRYLESLGKVRGFSWRDGQLSLSLSDGGELIFVEGE